MLDALAAKPVPSRPMTRDQLVNNARRFVRPLATLTVLGGALLFVAGPGCADEGIGDPCTPEQEYNKDFVGFDEKEVNVESKSFQCRTRICLVNHFRGRVSCPYGQGIGGEAPAGPGGSPCKIPGTQTLIEGAKVCKGGDNQGLTCTSDDGCPNSPATTAKPLCDFADTKKQSQVSPQCLDRTSDKAVYCSCRCADIHGQRPADQTFCACPDGFQCERLVTSIGQGNEGLTGSYCIKSHTQFDAVSACTQGDCDLNSKTKCN